MRADLPVVEMRQGFVHGAFRGDGFGPFPRPANAVGMRLQPAAGRAVCVVQMHGLRDPRGKRHTPERTGQAERLAAMARELARSGDARAVCGDFNVQPDSATFATLAELGLRELVVEGGFAGTRTSLYAKPRGGVADYMLVGEEVSPKGFEVVRDPEVSDHCPLLLEL